MENQAMNDNNSKNRTKIISTKNRQSSKVSISKINVINKTLWLIIIIIISSSMTLMLSIFSRDLAATTSMIPSPRLSFEMVPDSPKTVGDNLNDNSIFFR